MRQIVFRAGILALLLLASAAAAEQPAPMVAAVGSNMNHVPSFVGVEKGIFLRHGIDLKLKVLATGQEMAKALEAGEVQIIGSAYSNYPVAVERGMAARGVVGLMGDRTSSHSDEPVSVWTRKGTGIARIDDLAGRKVGTPVGGTADEYLTAVLAKKGLSRDKVNILNVPPGNLVVALRGGSVEAVAVWEPFGSQVQAKVPDAVLVARGGGYIGYYINMAVADHLIEKSPDLVTRYVLGMAEADQYTRQHPDEAAEIATRWIPGLDVAVAKEAIRHMSFDPRIPPSAIAAWDENVKILMDQKKLRSAVPWQKGVEPRFIESVMKTHPEFFSDLKPVP